ncbi:hypothetical protein DEU35_3272 [Microbacterium sp. AG157]|uniref:hypothetical protein n=1 Tax=Microbacterium sp. AG157 TaxID=2183993 RepID=UPI000E253BE9|nr:hypothetical protein [Microbacterium sp. AG157]REC96792.1 hypothetical protein DEU35_3272 [Microbacterium sp. AG157]
MEPRVFVLILTALAFMLPTLAAILTYRSAARAITLADFQAAEYRRIYETFLEEASGSRDEAAARKYDAAYAAIGYEPPTYTNMVSAPMLATARAVRAVLTGARSNAWLALSGLVCGFTASVWSLYLPSA